MATDFRIQIERRAPGFKFLLFGPNLPNQGQPLADRQPWAVTAAITDQLRRGEIGPVDLAQVQDETSKWTLGTDLDLALTSHIGQATADAVRLIWSVAPELRDELAEVPFELIRPQNAVIPYVNHPKVASFTHQLPKVGTPPNSPLARTWPFRCLLVRSNPPDLGGGVPLAVLLRMTIMQAAPAASAVQIDVLSAEVDPSVVGRPTLQHLERQLKTTTYEVVVFLGHGDLIVTPGKPSIGVLQLEGDDGQRHASVPSNNLSLLFHTYPVPVVLLLGCMTAAQVSAQMKPGVDQQLPQWMRGSQGLAQGLVNSESGVQVAIGMRYKIEAGDATTFLKEFFDSLLVKAPGHTERAVRAGRVALGLHGVGPAAWSAPMVFSTCPAEPLFDFLALPPPTCVVPAQHNDLRVLFWRFLSKIPWITRDPGVPASMHDAVQDMEQQLDRLEADIAAAMATTLLMPERGESPAGQGITIALKLIGPALDVGALEGRLVIDGTGVTVTALALAPPVGAAGFTLLAEGGGKPAVRFKIQRAGGPAQIAAGPVLVATLALDAAAKGVYPVTIDELRTQPNRALCPVGNAVIVTPP